MEITGRVQRIYLQDKTGLTVNPMMTREILNRLEGVFKTLPRERDSTEGHTIS